MQIVFNVYCFALMALAILFLNSCGTSPVPEKIYENTTRSGSVYSNEVWKGMVDITGDVTIYSGVVTIEPGTTVRFAAGSDDQAGGSPTPISDPPFPSDPAVAHSQISSIDLFGGTLYAVGTADNKILFTSSGTSPEASDWDAIQYNKTGSKLILQNTIIEYGYSGVGINVSANDSHIIFKDNIVRQIVAAGIGCGNPFSSPEVTITVSGNDISYCGHEGIATFDNADITAESNVFHDIWNKVDGGGAGIVIEHNNSTVRNNQFLRNSTGIIVLTEDSHPSLSSNTFEANGKDIEGFYP